MTVKAKEAAGAMKSTGIVRRVDDLGRIVIPMELRRTLDIGVRDSIEIFTDGDKIILAKYQPDCALCGSGKELTQFKGKNICSGCRSQLGKA